VGPELSKDILRELVMSEDDLLAEAVAKAKGLLAIEDKSGNVIVRVPKASLSARGLVGLHLTGRYFANKMGKSESARMSASELSAATGVEASTVSARLTELVDAGSVQRVGKGEFAINPYLMNDFLDEIASAREKPPLSQPSTSSPVLRSDTSQAPQVSGPDIGKFDSVTDAIVSLLGGPWGRIPRDWREIQQVLRHNSMLFSNGSVTGTLSLLWKSKRLRRVKEGRVFKYQVA
jgi:DNA-binding transcriptional ArsR family regulator